MREKEALIDNFKEKYLELKNQYKTDPEIAIEMHCSTTHIYLQKKKNGLLGLKNPRRNEQGLSERELRIGERNGLTRRLMLQRVRLRGWTNYAAINTPSQKKTDKRERYR